MNELPPPLCSDTTKRELGHPVRTALIVGLLVTGGVVLLGAASFLVLRPAPPFAFAGGVVIPDRCEGAQGLRIVATMEVSGRPMGSGDAELRDEEGACLLSFSFSVERADVYVLVLEISEGDRSRRFEGPTVEASSLEELQGPMRFPLSDFPSLAELAEGAQASG